MTLMEIQEKIIGIIRKYKRYLEWILNRSILFYIKIAERYYSIYMIKFELFYCQFLVSEFYNIKF